MAVNKGQGRTDENKGLSLRVAEALPNDVGRGLARLDPQDLLKLEVSIGDVIEIAGKRTTVARAMPAWRPIPASRAGSSGVSRWPGRPTTVSTPRSRS